MKENQINAYNYIAEKTGLPVSEIKDRLWKTAQVPNFPFYTMKEDTDEERVKWCEDVIDQLFKQDDSE